MNSKPRRRTIRVRDIMSSCPTALSPRDLLADAARRFTEEGISGAPVVDEGTIVGVLSKSDLVERSPFVPHSPRARVADAMTRTAVTVRGSDPAMSAVRTMLAEHVHRTIVIDKSGKPIGIVTTMDVLSALVRGDPLQEGEDAYLAREERHGTPAGAVEPNEPRAQR